MLWGYLGFVFPCAMLQVATILREKGSGSVPLSVPDALRFAAYIINEAEP